MPAPVLRTERLWLDSPVLSDRFAVAGCCRDPLYETLMTLPWPYELRHADFFLYGAVPGGWLSGNELTWALRTSEEGPLIGVIGWRRELGDVGFLARCASPRKRVDDRGCRCRDGLARQ